MKKVFILLLLIFAFTASYSQVPGVVAAQNVASAPPAGNPEMITNGVFDGTATEWNFGTRWSLVAGKAAYDNTGLGYLIQADGDMVSSIAPNTAYTLEFDFVCTGPQTMRFTSANGVAHYTENANYDGGHLTINFTTGADVSGGGFAIYSYDDFDSTVDNISLKLQ
jgi:hypothetical protein